MSGAASTCKICNHPERRRIELAVVGGASARATAKKFNASYNSLHRHMRDHVDDERRAVLLTGAARLADIAGRAADEAESLRDHLFALRNSLYSMFDTCHAAGDSRTAAQLAGRINEVNNQLGRITGELVQAGVTINNNTAIFLSPVWTDLRAELSTALSRHPEARSDILGALRALEARHIPDARMIDGRVLSHDRAAA